MSAVLTETHRPAIVDLDLEPAEVVNRREQIRKEIAHQVSASRDCLPWGYDQAAAAGWGERYGMVMGHRLNPLADQQQVRAALNEIASMHSECLRRQVDKDRAEAMRLLEQGAKR